MDKILIGLGIVFFMVGLVTGIAGVILAHYAGTSLGNSPSWLAELVAGVAFMVVGGLMVVFGVKKS